MEETFKKLFSNLNINLLIVLVIVILVWKIFNRVTKPAKADKHNVDKSKANITDLEAKRIAEAQFAAMNIYGTHEMQLFQTLSGLNAQALVMVYNEFGTKSYDPIAGVSGIFGVYPRRDLFGWYRGELTKKEADMMREVWKITPLHLTF